MKALPWLIAAVLLALNVIQLDNYQKSVEDYKAERDAAREEFQEGAKTFWDSQAESAAIRAAYHNENVYMALKLKQQELIIDAYEAELKHYRRETSGAIPEAGVPK